MIEGRKIIAFTPSGRRRYMEILVRYVMREVARGTVDEWIVFNNSYNHEDDEYTRNLAKLAPWITVLNDNLPIAKRASRTIHRFYRHLKDATAVYVRLDDDIVYVDDGAIEKIVRYKIAHRDAFLVFPTIIGNTRMAYWLQRYGAIPESFGKLTDLFLEPTAWRSGEFAEKVHHVALEAIRRGMLSEEFGLPTIVTSGASSEGTPNNRISVNSFAIDGSDMAACDVPWDEEGYLSHHRPAQLSRVNHVCGDAIVIHFAYHPQTAYMEATGMLGAYRLLAP